MLVTMSARVSLCSWSPPGERNPHMWIAGVDGCRGGWVAALKDHATGEVAWERFPTLAALLESRYRPHTVAIDMPIGLSDSGARRCDIEARRLLPGHASSVFQVPLRPVLAATDYWSANRLSREINGKGLSRQSFNIMAKIREVDLTVRALPLERVREAHPELAFVALNKGKPLARSKRYPEDLAERRALLSAVYGHALAGLEAQRRGQAGGGVDDLYDALALLQTAEAYAPARPAASRSRSPWTPWACLWRLSTSGRTGARVWSGSTSNPNENPGLPRRLQYGAWPRRGLLAMTVLCACGGRFGDTSGSRIYCGSM